MQYDYENLMRRCFKLAKLGEGRTNPNPMVGALIVKGGRIISTGYHRKAGEKHAEVQAIEKAGKKAKGATLIVNLEPCSTHGKTPPCTEAIISAGIKRVIIAVRDPNPLHKGRGIEILRSHGIEVIEGVLEEEAKELNRVFFKHIEEKIPYIVLKVAQSLDSRIADFKGNSKWISTESARTYLHKELRSKVDAILVGINTVLQDDPLLTARKEDGSLFEKQPIRVILDTKLRTPLNANVIRDKSTKTILVVTEGLRKKKKLRQLQAEGIVLLKVRTKLGKVDLSDLLPKLYKLGICHLLVEGGADVFTSFLDEKLVDEVFIFIGNRILGGPLLMYKGKGFKLEESPSLENMEVVEFKGCVLLRGRLRYV